MSTIISGSSPSVTFSDGTTQTTAASSAMSLISTQTASSSASLAWTGLTGYDKYLLIYENLIPATSYASLNCVVGTGSTTYITSGYYANAIQSYTGNTTPVGANLNNFIAISGLAGGANGIVNSGSGASGQIVFIGMTSGKDLCISGNGSAQTPIGATTYEIDVLNGFVYNNSTTKTAIKIYFGSSITSGSASLYGISS